MGKRLTTAATIVALLIGVWWWWPQATEDAIPDTIPPALQAEPDVYIGDAVISSFRASGALRYVLRSVAVEHFESLEETRLTEPRLELLPEGQNDTDVAKPPWHIQAVSGFVRNAPQATETGEQTQAVQEVVYLREDVVVTRATSDPRERLRIEAPTMDVYPERDFVETNREVMIESHLSLTYGVGMQGDLASGQLQLFSSENERVRSTIQPQL